MGLDAAFHSDNGAHCSPESPEDWSEWVSASRTYNYCSKDPLIDWLQVHGTQKGFKPDDENDGYDERADFRKFVIDQGNAMEDAVCRLIGDTHEIVRIATNPEAVRTQEAVEDTWAEMERGAEIIAQAVLRNPQTKTYGAVDLLFRSDVLAKLFPEDISAEAAAVPAPADSKRYWKKCGSEISNPRMPQVGSSQTELWQRPPDPEQH